MSSAQSQRVPFDCPEFGRGPSSHTHSQGASVKLGREFSPKPAVSLSLPLFGRCPSWYTNSQGSTVDLGREFSPSHRVPFQCPDFGWGSSGFRTAKEPPSNWAVSSAQSQRFPFDCPQFGRGPSWHTHSQGASVKLGREFSPKASGFLFTSRCWVAVHLSIRTAKDAPPIWAVRLAQSYRIPLDCPEFRRGGLAPTQILPNPKVIRFGRGLGSAVILGLQTRGFIPRLRKYPRVAALPQHYRQN